MQTLWTVLLGVVTSIQAALLVIAAGSSGGSVARERLKQTWSALLLTRLTPRQIVVGKALGAAAPGILGALGFVPIALWCLARAGPQSWLWTALAGAVLLLATPLTALLALRPTLRGRNVPAKVSSAAGLLWIGGPIAVQVLYMVGAIGGFILSTLGLISSKTGTALLALGGLLAVPLLLTSPLVALLAALPWTWSDTGIAPQVFLVRIAVIAVHLLYLTHLLRRAWRDTLSDAPRSAPDPGG
jgi:ABC-type Na+ efflux pump permease subunit